MDLRISDIWLHASKPLSWIHCILQKTEVEVEKKARPTKVECTKCWQMSQSQVIPVTNPDSLCNPFDSFLTYLDIF